MSATPESFTALMAITKALDERFPDGNDIFQRVSRLAEECGELAAAVNHKENMGIKHQKHGEATAENLVKEMQDVMRSVLGLARHYDLEAELQQSIADTYRTYQSQGYISQ